MKSYISIFFLISLVLNIGCNTNNSEKVHEIFLLLSSKLKAASAASDYDRTEKLYNATKILTLEEEIVAASSKQRPQKIEELKKRPNMPEYENLLKTELDDKQYSELLIVRAKSGYDVALIVKEELAKRAEALRKYQEEIAARQEQQRQEWQSQLQAQQQSQAKAKYDRESFISRNTSHIQYRSEGKFYLSAGGCILAVEKPGKGIVQTKCDGSPLEVQ